MSFTSLSTGGEYEHKLVVSEMPKHRHGLALFLDGQSQANSNDAVSAEWSKKYTRHDNPIYETGGDKPHNNLQPYVTTCFWKRIS